MRGKECEITGYRPQYKTEIIRLLGFLWGRDQDSNLSHFNWKYENNPFTKGPEAYVALGQGRVIGFLGFFINRWLVDGADKAVRLPVGGDLIVHPEYRDKGVMRALHEAAYKDFEGKYDLILVFSPNKNSALRAFSLGYIPLSRLQRLRKYHISLTLGSKRGRKSASKADHESPQLGSFGPFVVSEKPLVDPMNAFLRTKVVPGKTVSLLKDRDFLAWRYESPRRRYLFCYYYERSELKGYMVLRMTGHPSAGIILDFEQAESGVLDELIGFASGHLKGHTLSIWDLNLEKEIRRSLRKRHFIRTGLVERVLGKAKAESCILIRPTKKDYDDRDFHVQGLDLRKVENWEFKEICSDIS